MALKQATEVAKKAQREVSQLEKAQENMNTKVTSKDVPVSKRYEGRYNDYNNRDLEVLYQNVKDFQNRED